MSALHRLCSLALGALLVVGGVLGPAAARAQMTFTLDVVVVSKFEVESTDLTLVASEMSRAIEDELQSGFLVLPFSDIPPFDDYSAATYLDACPEGEYLGCAYVLGSRANANWMVAGSISKKRRSDDYDVVITILDIVESSAIVSFSATVTEDNHPQIAQGVAEVLDKVVKGEATTSDIRGDVDDPREAWERRRSLARAAAEELAREGGFEMAVRTEVPEVRPQRMTSADLDEYEDRDDVRPWDRLDMSRAEYVRYKNTGMSVAEFRQRAQGRLGQITISCGVGLGRGPYAHTFDGRWALDGDDIRITRETESLRQLQQGGAPLIEGDVAVGVHKWVELGLGLGTRIVDYEYYFWREVEGNVGQVIAQTEDGKPIDVFTPEYKFRATVIPMSTWVVRPTGTLSLAYWKGKRYDEVITLPDSPFQAFERPFYLSMYVAPGAEVSAGKILVFYTRLATELRLVGTAERDRYEHTGDRILEDTIAQVPVGPAGGWHMTFGITARLGPVFAKPAPTRPSIDR